MRAHEAVQMWRAAFMDTHTALQNRCNGFNCARNQVGGCSSKAEEQT